MRRLWRGFLAIEQVDWRTLQRRGISQIDESDEEASVQSLLALVPAVDPGAYQLPSRFDARAAQTRLALLGMVSLAPRDLTTGRPIDVAALIEESELAAFRRVVAEERSAESPANRVILPGSGLARAELSDVGGNAEILRSHGINAAACQALHRGDRRDVHP